MCTGTFPGVKCSGRGANHLPPFSAKTKLSGSSWPVPEWDPYLHCIFHFGGGGELISLILRNVNCSKYWCGCAPKHSAFGKSLFTNKRCCKCCPRASIQDWTHLIVFANTLCRSACEMFLMYAGIAVFNSLNFRRRIKSRLPFAGIIRSSPYSTRFQDKG